MQRLLVGLVIACLMTSSVWAEPCPVAAGVTLAGAPADPLRLAFLRENLQREEANARFWSQGWLIGYSALMLGQLAISPLVPKEARVDYYVGAASTVAGFLPLTVTRLPILRNGSDFQVQAAKAVTPADTCAAIASGETLLLATSDAEALGRSVPMHILSALYNIGVGLVLGLAFDRWASGIRTAIIGIGIGEAMVWTQPHGSIDDLHRYQAGDLGASTVLSFHLAPLEAPGATGLVLAGTF